jgi:hypothetical protein
MPWKLNQFFFYHFIVGSSSHWLLVIFLPVLYVLSRIRCEEEYCVGIGNFIKPLLVIRVVLWVHDCSPQEEQLTGSDILIMVLENFEKFNNHPQNCCSSVLS